MACTHFNVIMLVLYKRHTLVIPIDVPQDEYLEIQNSWDELPVVF